MRLFKHRNATRAARLGVERLEDRLTPSWAGIPPTQITVPSSPTLVTLNSSGDATGSATIATTEVDWYRFTARAGTHVISATTPTGRLDTVIGVFNSAGQRVAYNDDISSSNWDSRLSVNLAAGTYYLGVTNYTGSAGGSYVWAIDGPSTTNAAGTFQVAAQSYQVSEGSASLTVTVNRTGGSTGAVTVRYATANGTAVAGSDYTSVSGTLSFAAGQTSATVVIPIINNTVAESTETFTLSLSNPTGGAALGTPAAATISILDNDSSPPPPPPPPPPTGGFSITLQTTGLTANQRNIFQQAANRWAQIITGDLPNATYQGVAVDDVLINASSVFIDGSGGILGQAGPDAFRSGTQLPYHGVMEFDSADLASLESSGGLYYTVLHEIGHILGIGTIWGQRGLVAGAGTSNSRYTGANAVAAYNSIFGTSATSVPLETGGGAGTRDSHWRESIFGNELMTGYLNGGNNPLSRVTVASLADLGYVVNMSAADSYTPPGGGSLVAGSSGGTGGAGLRASLPPSIAAALAPVFSNLSNWASDLGLHLPSLGGSQADADWIEDLADRLAGIAADPDLDLVALPVSPAFDPFDDLAGLA